eukprot:m.118563 g.118563  ORF g.118563 m.118563 type:complete len:793 (+) comp14280_c0_seq7:106-2484(+)
MGAQASKSVFLSAVASGILYKQGYAVTSLAVAIAAVGLTAIISKKAKNGSVVRSKPKGPLAGLTVIDMSVVIAGPWISQLLCEMGADVVKVENMDLPDSARGFGDSSVRGLGAMFQGTSGGKKSIVLNLKSSKGKKAFLELVKRADVFVQNFRPGAMDRLGISYKDLKEVNPDLIMLSSTGFGTVGPKSTQRVYDFIIQAACGVTMSNSSDGIKPKFISHLICDKVQAMQSAGAILAAAYARNSGACRGQNIDMAMIDSAIWFFWPDVFGEHILADKTVSGSKPIDINGNNVPSTMPTKAEALASSVESFRYTANHLLFGPVRRSFFPVKFSRTPVSTREYAPMLGEHSNMVLKDLDFSSGEIKSMLANKEVVSTASLLNSANQSKKAMAFNFLECLQDGPSFQSRFKGKLATETRDCAPLTGIRVVELASCVEGPLAAFSLMQHGAAVVKVEMKGHLDPARKFGLHHESKDHECNMGTFFMAINNSKDGVLLDRASQLDNLLQTADVLVVDERHVKLLSLDLSTIEKTYPKLVIGIVQEGPNEHEIQAMLGAAEAADGYNQIVTYGKATGLHLSNAILAALLERLQSNQGQKVSIDPYQSAVHLASLDTFINDAYPKSVIDKPSGMKFPIAIETLYKYTMITSDGQYFIGLPVSDKEYACFLEAFADKIATFPTEIQELMESKRSLPARFKSQKDFDALMNIVIEITGKCTGDEFLKRCNDHGVPCHPNYTFKQALNDENVENLHTCQELTCSQLGTIRYARPAAKFSMSSKSVKRYRAPLPGEQNSKYLS